MARRKMESPEKPTTKRTFMEELPVKPKVSKPHPLGIGTNDLLEFAHASESSTDRRQGTAGSIRESTTASETSTTRMATTVRWPMAMTARATT